MRVGVPEPQEARATVPRQLTWRVAALLFTAYSALAVLLTFPLARQISSVLPHDLGDPLHSAATLSWNAHVLPLTSRWWDGFAFFPVGGMLAFSDHRLGLSLIASPIQWLGGSAITAYNLTLLATFGLTALAAHAFGLLLTKRHDAALVCALAYGFNPYRIAHIEHIELLAAFGMPAALLCLHGLKDTRRPRWLLYFVAALTLQGLCSSYYLALFSVLLVLWTLWFVDWKDWRLLLGVAAGCLVSIVALLPIITRYVRIHQAFGMAREYGEVKMYSADLSSLATASPLVAVWGWTSSFNTSERQLFPGLTVVVIVLTGVGLARRASRATAHGSMTSSYIFAALAGLVVAIAIGVRLFGPWHMAIGPLRASATEAFKPLSVALVFLLAAIALAPSARTAMMRRSPLAFYVFAAAFLFLCSLGPEPRLRGTQILYEPPYRWLMRLPVFGSDIRAPARFAMPAILALSTAASLSCVYVLRFKLVGRLVLATAVCGLVLDTWIGHLPLIPVPVGWSAERAEGSRAVLELPLGDVEPDVEAMYRATRREAPAVNGYSAYAPPYYAVLRRALREEDETIMPRLAVGGSVLVAVDTRNDPDARWRTLTERVPGVTPVGDEMHWSFFRLPEYSPDVLDCEGAPVAFSVSSAPEGSTQLSQLMDGRMDTAWISDHAQRAGEVLVVDLDHSVNLCSVSVSLGRAPEDISVSARHRRVW